MATVSDIVSLRIDTKCRICMFPKPNLSSLFRRGLSMKVMKLADIKMYEGDGLPSTICLDCELEVNRCVNFIGQIQRADMKLREMIDRESEFIEAYERDKELAERSKEMELGIQKVEDGDQEACTSQIDIEEFNVKQEITTLDNFLDEEADPKSESDHDHFEVALARNDEPEDEHELNPLNHVDVMEDENRSDAMDVPLDPLGQDEPLIESEKCDSNPSTDPLTFMKQEAVSMDIDKNSPEPSGSSSTVKSARATNQFPDCSTTPQDEAMGKSGMKVQSYIILSPCPSNIVATQMTDNGISVNTRQSLPQPPLACSSPQAAIDSRPKQYLLLTTSSQNLSNFKQNTSFSTLNVQNKDKKTITGNSGNLLLQNLKCSSILNNNPAGAHSNHLLSSTTIANSTCNETQVQSKISSSPNSQKASYILPLTKQSNTPNQIVLFTTKQQVPNNGNTTANITLNSMNVIGRKESRSPPPLIFTNSNQTAANLATRQPAEITAGNKLFFALLPSQLNSTSTLLNVTKPNTITTNVPSPQRVLGETYRSTANSERSVGINKVLLTSKESMNRIRLQKFKEQLKRKQDGGDFCCLICCVDCGDAECFQQHKEEKNYICRICTDELGSHGELESHFLKHLSYQCSFCEDVFIGRHDRSKHEKDKHSDKRSFTCEICDKGFFRKKSLHGHRFKYHSVKVRELYKCEVCGQAFKHPSVLKAHAVATHCAYEHIECKYCEKILLGPIRMRTHVKVIHLDNESNRAAACQQCGKVFKRISILIAHQEKTHKRAESLCELCGKSLKNNIEMRNHMRSEHSKPGTFSCKHCDKTFATERFLRAHVNQSHRIKKPPTPVFCEICGRLFKSKMILKNHKKIHSDERPYKCEICSATFRQEVALKTHGRVHSSVGVYNCVKCGMDFKWKQTLDKHVRKCKADEDFLDKLDEQGSA